MLTSLPEALQVRRPTLADASAVLTLMLARDQADYGRANMTEDHIRTFWQAPGFDMTTDAWIVATHDEWAVGYASLWHEQYARFYAYFTALPVDHHPAIKAYLLECVERRAQELQADASSGAASSGAASSGAASSGAASSGAASTDVPVTLGAEIADVNHTDQDLLARLGYARARASWRMEIDLQAPLPAPIWPAGITVRACVPERDAHAIYTAEEEAFADSWNHTPTPFETWRHFNMTREGFDPSLWFLACEGETIAGVCLCNYWLDDGFVAPLAVRRPWRRRGLGLALLRHAFAEFHRRGTRTVMLMVDTQNLTGATRLYERAGMRVTQLHHLYTKPLRPGPAPTAH